MPMCQTHVALHLSNEYSDIGSSLSLNLVFSIRKVDLKKGNFSGTSTDVIFIHCFHVKLELFLGSVGCCGGRNTGEPGEKPLDQGRDNNIKLGTLMGAGGLTTGPSLLSGLLK